MRAYEFINELKYFGSPCTKDCSGHRAGAAWYKKKQKMPQQTHPSFMKGATIAQQQQQQGINTISGGITNTQGQFQAFQPGRLQETVDAPGWKVATRVRIGSGLAIFGERVDEQGTIAEIKMLYYDKSVNDITDQGNEFDDGLVFGICVRNNNVYQYEFNNTPKLLGKYDMTPSELEDYFINKVNSHKTNMEESQQEIPGLREFIRLGLSAYGKPYDPTISERMKKLGNSGRTQ